MNSNSNKLQAHTNQISHQLRNSHGDAIADTWHPMVEASLTALYSGSDLNQPLVIAGKEYTANGRTITALGVLDMVADVLGVAAISQDHWFDTL